MEPTSPFTDGGSGPPPIPGARSDSTGAPIRPLLIWVRTGTAHVHIDDAVAFHLAAGEGAWIPAGGWNHRAIVTEPGTVDFPLWPDPGGGLLSVPTRFNVPDDWQDWLIQHFNLQVTPLSGRGYSPVAIGDLLRHRSLRPLAPVRSRDREPSVFLDRPVMPRADGARAVAERLLRDPALNLTVEEWAAQVLSSSRVLRRDFLAGTGLTFEQWRLHRRLNAGVALLAAGYDVDQVSTQVGFASRNGFTRAFKQQFGLTPYEFCRKLAARNPSQRAPAAHPGGDLMQMVGGNGALTSAPGLLPAANTPVHANDVHVLSWMYRGSGYLDIGDRHYERQRGVATWIPANLEHTTGIGENSISLPLGSVTTGDLQLNQPLQVKFSPAWDDYLMFCSVSARSILQPDNYDPGHVLGLFSEQVAAQRALEVPMPTDPRAREAALHYLRRPGASGGSAVPDIPPDVHQAFRAETGMTFARWRYAARMRIARDLLTGGAKPSAVARRVGYAHLPTFSTAFSRFHGLSPREYQERQIEKT